MIDSGYSYFERRREAEIFLGIIAAGVAGIVVLLFWADSADRAKAAKAQGKPVIQQIERGSR